MQPSSSGPRLRPLPPLIFLSRRLLLPLYPGPIVAQAVHARQFVRMPQHH